MRRIRKTEDFVAGLLFMTIGTLALVLVTAYPMGQATRMGPGYFPRALGFLLLVFGAVLSLRALKGEHEPGRRWHLPPLAIILASLAIFCVALRWTGLVVAGTALVALSSFASREVRWREAILSGIIQSAVAVVVFVYGLNIPLPIWPAFLAGAH